ncbi:MAG: nucleoside recognition protein [Verrucomicrobiota bacterium]|nr:nucleoside recognition protein [Chthoniobacterales bacterium]MDQ3627146.1 nucleoside recognition protein [Verrucomicrobiota bacterium]
MLNYIWLTLVVLAVAIGGWADKLKDVTDGAFDGAKTAVTIALGLIGIMALWLGLMRLAERCGLVQRMARWLRPVMRRLFPDVPPEHPAMGSMLMNMAANMLGLGNAATPLGLRAMRDLESLNPRPGVASNAMCTFLAINTSSVQLIPATAIALLASAGSRQPTIIVGTALMATLCSTAVGITAVKLLEKMRAFRLPEIEPRPDRSAAIGEREIAPAPEETLAVEAPVGRAPWWGSALTMLLSLFFVALFVRMVWPGVFGLPLAPEAASQTGFVRGVNAISLLAIPFLLSFFPLYAAVRGVKVYEEFVEGAKEGFAVILKIIPFLVTMLVAINMFKGAGGIDLLTRWLTPVFAPLHFPPDLLPLSLMRPLSGGASLAIFTEMIQRLGPDNIVTLMAATIFGSTETTFYVVAVYFGAVGIKQTRHAIPAGLLADLAGIIAAVIICRAVLG